MNTEINKVSPFVEDPKLGDSTRTEEKALTCITPMGESSKTNESTTIFITPKETDQIQCAGMSAVPETSSINMINMPAAAFKPSPQKRLSGARRRKIRKEERTKAGTWKPLTSVNFQVDEMESSDIKRFRSDSPTFLTLDQQTSMSNLSTSNSVSETELKMAVIDRRHPDVTLNRRQADLIQNKLLTAVDESLLRSANPPQFESSKFTGGILWLTCANEFTKEWLKMNVESLSKIWEGVNLITVTSKNLPKRPKVLVRIPGSDEEEVVRTRLGRQNPGLNIGEWRLLNRKPEKEGMCFAYSVDAASYNTLTLAKFKAYYGLRTVMFKTIQGTVPKHDDMNGLREPLL